MSSPTRPASQEEQTVSPPDELRHVAGCYKSEHDEMIDDYPVSAATSLGYSHRLANLADALDALREAVKGCGKKLGADKCGDAPFFKHEVLPQLCIGCEMKRAAAILSLTGVTTHE